LDPAALEAAVKALPQPDDTKGEKPGNTKTPRRKPGARECMQISRRFGVNIIPEKYMNILLDYCRRGKVEHLIKMRERLDCHSRFLESQLAGLESVVKEVGESKVVVPALPPHKRDSVRQRVSVGSVITHSEGNASIPVSNKRVVLGTTTKVVAVALAPISGKIPPASHTASTTTTTSIVGAGITEKKPSAKPVMVGAIVPVPIPVPVSVPSIPSAARAVLPTAVPVNVKKTA